MSLPLRRVNSPYPPQRTSYVCISAACYACGRAQTKSKTGTAGDAGPGRMHLKRTRIPALWSLCKQSWGKANQAEPSHDQTPSPVADTHEPCPGPGLRSNSPFPFTLLVQGAAPGACSHRAAMSHFLWASSPCFPHHPLGLHKSLVFLTIHSERELSQS